MNTYFCVNIDINASGSTKHDGSDNIVNKTVLFPTKKSKMIRLPSRINVQNATQKTTLGTTREKTTATLFFLEKSAKSHSDVKTW